MTITADKQKIIESFNFELKAIPISDFELSTKYIKNNYVKNLSGINFCLPRKGDNISDYGNFVVIDTETTGIGISSELIELSAIRFRDFTAKSAFTTLIKPKETIPKMITGITKITNEMVERSPSVYQVMPAFIDFVGNDDLIGHNLMFDLKFVYKYGFDFQERPRRYFDTMAMSKEALCNIENNKLATVCNYYSIYRNDAHRSLSDCLATAKIYIRLLDEYKLIKDKAKNPAPSLMSVAEKLRETVRFRFADFHSIDEDTPELLKIHMYTTNNVKIGIAKVSKSDLSVQFRRIGSKPAIYDLSSPEDIKNYL